MPTPSQHITVCGVAELPQRIKGDETHWLCLLWKEEGKPIPFDHIDFEFLHFRDVAMPGPESFNDEHMARLLAFGERVHADQNSRLLVNCHAGVSRSTAAAAILLCQHAPGQEEAAFMRLAEIRPQALPNQLMCATADRLLQRNGALLNALEVWLRHADANLIGKPHG
jgi:predicted protein tyrosine phosphatase